MAKEKVWAVAVESDLVGYVTAPSKEAAIERWREQERIGPDLTPDELVYAIPAEAVLDSIEVPGYLLSAVEYGAEFAGIEPGTPEWDELQDVERELGDRVNRVLGWLRVDSVWDLWVPVVDTREGK